MHISLNSFVFRIRISYMRRIIVGLFCLMQTDNKIQSEQFEHTPYHKYHVTATLLICAHVRIHKWIKFSP